MSGRLGRYEILKTIASGGMATVALARVVGAGGFERLVAIKSMHPHIAAEPDFVAMFLDEARLAARVRHPNVVPTIDVQEDPLFLVMEFIEGPTLHLLFRSMRKQSQRLPLPVLLRVILDVLAGLHAAHELVESDGTPVQLVHRDVSPQNMLVGVDGVARITDFGVARAESRLSSTRGGQVKGKIAYMAPEQVRSDPVDRRCDVYAAAVVLWEGLTGRPLFRADNEGALVAQVSTAVNPPPRDVEPTVPPAIDAACAQALRAAPDERYPSAAAFAEALERAAREDGVVLASPREVGAFVSELAAHRTPETMDAAPPSFAADAAAANARASSSGTEISSTVSHPGASAAASVAWRRLAIAAGLGAAVAGGLFLAFGGRGATVEPGAATPSAVALDLVTTPPSALPSPSPSPSTAPSAAPTSSAAPAPSAVSSASAEPVVPKPPGAGRLPPPPSPRGPGQPGQPSTFRPSGL